MKKSNNEYGINVGSSTLIMIFALLCLTIFALLTYKTALNEKNLSQKAAKEIKYYYEADYKASKIKDEIEYKLNRGEDISSIVDYKKVIGGSLYIGYSVEINEYKKLDVEIKKDGNKFVIVKWKEVSNNNDEEYKNKMDVWRGI